MLTRQNSTAGAHTYDWWAGVSRLLLKTCIVALAIVAFNATTALAYQESAASMNPSATASFTCPDCHGLESGIDSPTVAPRSVPSTWTWDSEAGTDVGTRKGPHGGYTPGTQKCQTCHTIHNAAYGAALLPEATIADTCFTCHDGTGGGGVYGVIQQRTGLPPAASHYIGVDSLNATGTVTVPGGDQATGGSIETTFTGENGALTCTDCHSPHNSNTVAPFVGDRRRSVTDTTTVATATNRLLKIRPTTSTTTMTVYGSGWCASCHKGSHKSGGPGTSHSVETSDTLRNYSKVVKLSGLNTSITAAGQGSLGGDNFGYIMPDTVLGTGGHSGEQPICQQCHEDARSVGAANGAVDQFEVDTTQQFVAPVDGISAGNPTFQNFPHESENGGLLIETGSNLCDNCHRV